MAEGNSAERACKERQAKAHKGRELLRRGRFRGKEQRPKHQRGGGAEDVEIKKLHRRANQAGREDAGVLADRVHGAKALPPISAKSSQTPKQLTGIDILGQATFAARACRFGAIRRHWKIGAQMNFNPIPAALWRLTASAVLTVNFVAGPLVGPTHAAREQTYYTFDGMTFSEAERSRIGKADSQTQQGITALYKSDWAGALQHCRFAWATFRALIPKGPKTVEFFNQVEACVADSLANLSEEKVACEIYRSNGYQTYRVRDPKTLCAKYPAAEVASTNSNNEYAVAAGSFIDRLAQLSAMPRGSVRQAKAAELVPDCDKLRSYAASVPPALAAAGFCNGVVARERADARTSCKIMWTSAGQIRTAFASQLTPNMRAHAVDLQAMLDSFGPTCARDGYPWPEFSAAWPH